MSPHRHAGTQLPDCPARHVLRLVYGRQVGRLPDRLLKCGSVRQPMQEVVRLAMWRCEAPLM